MAPFAADRLEDDLNPVGRLYYSGSTFLCGAYRTVPVRRPRLRRPGRRVAIRQLGTEAGFTHVRRAAHSAFNLVYEIRH